jgi:signal transduction histidine kinase
MRAQLSTKANRMRTVPAQVEKLMNNSAGPTEHGISALESLWEARAEALLLAAEQLNSADDPEQVLKQLVEAAARLFSVRWVALATNQEDHALRRYTWDESAIHAQSDRLPLEDSLSGWVISSRTPFRSNDVRSETLNGRPLADYRFASALSVPVISRSGHVMGALNLHEPRDGRAFSPIDERLARAIAQHAAFALERLELTRALQERARALELRTEEQEAFIHTVSHALKTPLSSVIASAEIAAEEIQLTHRVPDREMSIIIRNGERMRVLLEDLVGLTRAGTGLDKAMMASLSLDEVVNSAEQEVAVELGARMALITRQSRLPFVIGHAGRLAELFTNLIDNALKYTPANRRPRIHIEANLTGEFVSCAVSDNGIGIAHDQWERIFGLFERLPEARELKEGSGIGLAVVKRVVELHGGQIWVESSNNRGSCFRFTLPAAKCQAK